MGRLHTFNNLVRLSFKERPSAIRRFLLLTDILWERLIYKTEIQDYFQYGFHMMSNLERRTYMTYSNLRYTMRVCNDASKKKLFDNKAEFNRLFQPFLRREWINVTDCNYDDFSGFVDKHPVFFAKAREGMFGKFAGRYDLSSAGTAGKKESFESLKKNGCIAEELIEQCDELGQFNMDSANTLRIVTLRTADDGTRIMAGVLRIGRKGKSADNFHHMGIASAIDINTGIVISSGIDREFNRYIVHPDSGRQIIGFNIPGWDEACGMVRKAAEVIPGVRYVGWDVAIGKDGHPILIEGNYGPDPDVTQMTDRKGKWKIYKPYIDEIAKIRSNSKRNI